MRDIEVFRAVVEHGGFRAASTQLGVAQSAVSNRIAAVEHQLGIELFDRRKRGAILTPAGRRLFEEGARLVSMRDNIVRQLANEAHTSGSLHIGVAETVLHTSAPEFLATVAARLPKLRLELSVDVSSRLSWRLDRGELDVAIIVRDFAPAFAEVETGAETNLIWAAPASLGLPDRPLGADDLVDHPIITFPSDSFAYRHVKTVLSQSRKPLPLIHGCASLTMVRDLVSRGVGIGTIPERMVRDPAFETLIKIPRTAPSAQLAPHIFALYHTLPRQSPIATALVESFRSIYGKDQNYLK